MKEFKYDNTNESTVEDYDSFINKFDKEWDNQFNTTTFRVETSNHGWRNKSGEFMKEYEHGHQAIEDIVEGVGSWTIEARIDNTGCYITLYSHDNPTGANFEIYPEEK